MSTKYSGLPNDYETLINDKPNWPGAATMSAPNQWIQATFEQPAIVTKVIVSAPTQGEFGTQGWGGTSSMQSYLGGSEIQSSDDGTKWDTLAKVDATSTVEGFVTIPLPQPKLSKLFRLFKTNGYIATGSFILE